MHILVIEEFVPAGEVILATETMIHFGQGQMSAELSLATRACCACSLRMVRTSRLSGEEYWHLHPRGG